MVGRALSGDAGYLALVFAPAIVLTAVWVALGETGGQWDVVSLAIGLAWVIAAQISVLAHVRRTERQLALADDLVVAVMSDNRTRRLRLYAALIACAALLAIVYTVKVGAISVAGLLVALGLAAVALAMYEVGQWKRGSITFPWSTVAIGLAGLTMAVLQMPTGQSAVSAIHTVVVALSAAGAFCIWAGLLARDLRELRGN